MAEARDFDFEGSPKKGLAGATAGFFFGFAAVALYGPTAARFNEVMELDPLLLGFLASIPMLSGSLLRIPFGAWCESTGGRKPFMILMVLSVTGMVGLTTLLYTVTPSGLTAEWYPVLLVLGALSGCGIATFSVGIGQTSYWFPQEKQGGALGIYAGVGNIAPGIFSFIIPVALTSLGLPFSYLLWLVFLVLGTLVYYRFGVNAWYFQLKDASVDRDRAREIAREYGQELFPEGTPRESLVDSALVWKTWVLVALYFTTFGGFLALTAWYPTYWIELFEFDATVAGLLTGLFSVYASLIRVPGGSLADRIGGEATAALALTALLLGALALTVTRTFVLAAVGTFLVATGMGVNNAAVFKKVPEEVPEAVSGASGWVGGLGAFGGFVIPPVLGMVVAEMGTVGYARGFLAFVVLAILALLLVYVLQRTRSRVDVVEPAGA
jgi:NNP family nitrate/nitrite transporter-like MFS transporter